MEKEIVHLYTERLMSIESLCRKFNIGKITIKKILFNNNIPIRKKPRRFKNKMMFKRTWSSSGEKEMRDFIKNLGFNTKKSKNRTLLNGKEIDILIEDKKTCFEYNGLYYHTEKMGKHVSYHLDKTTDCFNLGYHLYHIFEDEWILKKELVKSKIKEILGVNGGIKVDVKKLVIKKVGKKERSFFLSENHIQGNDKSLIGYGAYYKDNLVSVMTFRSRRNRRKNTNPEIELSRFCVKQNYSISGVAEKILKKFIYENNPHMITTFVDRRWAPDTHNNLYTELGFTLVKTLKPTHTYYNSKLNRYKRYKKLDIVESGVLESVSETIIKNGFEKIWDCGFLKYELLIQKRGL